MKEVHININKNSGFCFGVVEAIKRAEEELAQGKMLYCLGDIVHNSVEVERLCKKGLVTIDHKQLKELDGVTVLFRAHGEPPSTYEIAKKNNISLVDATCPVVLRLQKRVKDAFLEAQKKNGQIVIYGQKGHAEVNGLIGQTNGEGIVVENLKDLEVIDFSRPIWLYSQTTKNREIFAQIKQEIINRLPNPTMLTSKDTICGQVANRIPKLRHFAEEHEIVIFVSGRKSSNGRILFQECQKVNPETYFISCPQEVDESWLTDKSNIGICGATSTPRWLMEEVQQRIKNIITQNL